MGFSSFILYLTLQFITFFSFSATVLKMPELWHATGIKFVDKVYGIEQ